MQDKTRVLIVDDDVSFAKGLTDILNEKGYEVSVVHNGEDAFRKAKEIIFDVALLDIKLPVMNGVEVFKRLKTISPKTVMMMMTAYTEDDLIKSALKEGTYGVMYKPLNIDKTLSMIERAKGHGALIMVVDDDPNIRITLKDLLENKGYMVTLASNGEEAIRMVQERPIDIIFIDLKLPVLNGLDTYLAIKKVKPDIIAVMITAYQKEKQDTIEAALKQGVFTCLYKPFEPNEFLGIFDNINKRKHNSVKTLLIVDDEANIRKGLNDIFSLFGHKIMEAASGEEALEKIRGNIPDLVLLDTSMSGIDGIETCRQIKHVERFDTKVLIYTGKIDAIDAVRAREAGADEYCIKGSDPAFLIETANKII